MKFLVEAEIEINEAAEEEDWIVENVLFDAGEEGNYFFSNLYGGELPIRITKVLGVTLDREVSNSHIKQQDDTEGEEVEDTPASEEGLPPAVMDPLLVVKYMVQAMAEAFDAIGKKK